MTEKNMDSVDPNKDEGSAEPKEAVEETQEIDVEDLKKKADLATNYKIRAEKAEKEAKALKDDPRLKGEAGKDSELSTKDVLALAKSNVHNDDLEEVLNFAKFKKISVADALKSDYVKTFTSQKEEERKTAEATQTKGARGSSKVSSEKILDEASKGKLPDDEDGISQLIAARIQRRKGK